MPKKEPQTKPVPMEQWSVEPPFDSAEYLGRRAAHDSSQRTPSKFKQDPDSDEDVEQVLAVFDEHGVQVNPNAPAFISDEDAARRWEVCVRLARGMTRQPALHPETRMAATSMFHSDIPTDDEGSPPDADTNR